MKLNARQLFLMACLCYSLPIYGQENDSIAVPYRKPLFDFNPQQHPFNLTASQRKNISRLLRMSVITRYREGVMPVTGGFDSNFQSQIDNESGTHRIMMYNVSIEEMFTHGMINSSRVLLKVKDSGKYRYDASQGSRLEWMRKNALCFEYVVPSGQIRSTMQWEKELARLLGLIVTTEKRPVKSLILIRTSKLDKIKSKGIGDRGYDHSGKFNNVPIDRLSDFLYQADMPPFFDETGYSNPVDLDLNIKSWADLPLLRRELQRYDLNIVDGIREVEMLVIREKDYIKD